MKTNKSTDAGTGLNFHASPVCGKGHTESFIKINAYAKINLFLNVLQKRPDGYHDVDMLMQAVDLCDILNVSLIDNGIFIECSNSQIPRDNTNLAYRAAEQFFQHTKASGGALIKIDKKIPVEAGLAGGSSDAAGVLWGLNELYKKPLKIEELAALGARLGADVPFCVMAQSTAGAGTCYRAQGIGERLAHIPRLLPLHCVIAKPAEFSVSTKEAYELLDLHKAATVSQIDKVIDGIVEGNVSKIAQNSANVFEGVIIPKNPQIAELKLKLLSCGADFALMSGSGSAVFGIFADKKAAQAALAQIKNITKQAYICRLV